MIIPIVSMSILFAFCNMLNFYTSSLFFYIDVVPILLIFCAKELNGKRYLIALIFILLMSLFFEKFVLTHTAFIIIFALLSYKSKKLYDIISVKYIVFFILVYLICKYTLFSIVVHRKIGFHKLAFYDMLINTLGNCLLLPFLYMFFDSLYSLFEAKK
jgi:hypothetical protein